MSFAEFWQHFAADIWPELLKALGETLYMTVPSVLLAYLVGLPLRVLHVAEPGDAPLDNPDTQEALNCLYALSRDNGAVMTVLYNADVRGAIVRYATLVHAVCVVVGNDRQDSWAMAQALEELVDESVTVMRA